MLDDFFDSHKNSKLFRLFFGSPDLDYRGIPTEEEDKAFDLTMNIFGMTAAIGTIVLLVLK